MTYDPVDLHVFRTAATTLADMFADQIPQAWEDALQAVIDLTDKETNP